MKQKLYKKETQGYILKNEYYNHSSIFVNRFFLCFFQFLIFVSLEFNKITISFSSIIQINDSPFLHDYI